MRYTLVIKGKLSNLNDYITACRTNHYKGASVKKKNENIVKCAIYEQLTGQNWQAVVAVQNWQAVEVLEHVKEKQLDKPIKQIAPVNDEMIDIAI